MEEKAERRIELEDLPEEEKELSPEEEKAVKGGIRIEPTKIEFPN